MTANEYIIFLRNSFNFDKLVPGYKEQGLRQSKAEHSFGELKARGCSGPGCSGILGHLLFLCGHTTASLPLNQKLAET